MFIILDNSFGFEKLFLFPLSILLIVLYSENSPKINFLLKFIFRTDFN